MYFVQWLSRQNSIVEVYIALTLYGIGLSLVGIFIPIYLISLGFSLQEALLYILINKVVLLFAIPFTSWLQGNIGLQATTLIRIPFFLTSFIGLLLLPSHPWLFWVSAVAGGLALILFWLPIQLFFFHSTEHAKRGSQVGLYFSIPALFKASAPAIGGFIAVSFGFDVLLLIGLFIVVLSTVPLFLSSTKKIASSFRLQDLFRERDHSFVAMTVSDGFEYVASAILFPLLIFFVLESVDSVGLIKSLGMVVFGVASFFVGKQLDGTSRKRTYAISAFLFACSLFLRPFLSTPLEFSLVIILGGLAFACYKPSYETIILSKAHHRDDSDTFLVAREVLLNFSRSVLLAIVIIVPFVWGFFLAGIALLISSFVVYRTTS